MNHRLFISAITLSLAITPAAWSEDHPHSSEHQHHGAAVGESDTAVNEAPDHQHHHAHPLEHNDDAPNQDSHATLTRTDEIDRALAAGGTPIVADVLGVVCDFCALAMNKIFGSRPEVAAVYVDLDTKALSLVLSPGSGLSDAEIAELAVQAGYRIAAIRRDEAALGISS